MKQFITCILLSIPACTLSMTGFYTRDIFESLEDALKADRVEFIRDFVRRNQSTVKDYYGWTLLHKAVYAGAPNITRYLLSLPQIMPNIPEGSGQQTPLHIAIAADRAALIPLLLAHPAIDINSKDIGQETPLHYAVRLYKPEIVNTLIRHPHIQLHNTDLYSNTPLHTAASKGFKDLVEILLQAGADESIVNDKHQTAAQLARAFGHEATADYILQFSVLKQQLFNAIKENNIPVVTRLLSSISPASITDAQGNTPLHVAAEAPKASRELVELLFYVAPGTIARINKAGETPIHKASKYPAKLAVFLR
jgi:ankyrin repeat protein